LVEERGEGGEGKKFVFSLDSWEKSGQRKKGHAMNNISHRRRPGGKKEKRGSRGHLSSRPVVVRAKGEVVFPAPCFPLL